MLKDDELDALARAVAALGDEDAGRLDDAVRARREEAAADRQASLRALSDIEVVKAAMAANEVANSWPPEPALQVLRVAGFARGDDLKALYVAGWNGALAKYPDDGAAEFLQGMKRAIERVLVTGRA
ncbi:hypothetical protein ACUXK4_004490 [Methylorubrum extorquens]